MLRDGEGHKVATTIVRRDNPSKECTGCNVCRQRSSYQADQNTNILPQESTHRALTPLYQGNGRPQINHDERDNREGEPGRSPYQTPPNEQVEGMDDEDLFQQLIKEWINE